MMDQMTKMLLLAIATGLWVNVLMTWLEPVPVQAIGTEQQTTTQDNADDSASALGQWLEDRRERIRHGEWHEVMDQRPMALLGRGNSAELLRDQDFRRAVATVVSDNCRFGGAVIVNGYVDRSGNVNGIVPGGLLNCDFR